MLSNACISPYAGAAGFVSPPEISNKQKAHLNIIFTGGSNSSTGCKPGTVSSLIGKNNQEKAFRFLVAKGLTAEQAAGVVGNLIVESGVIPDNQEDSETFPSGGWGIAQWTASRRDEISAAVLKAGLPYTNEATPADKLDALLLFELNYMWDEATERGDIVKLKKETTVAGAAQSWLDNFEIAGIPATSERIKAGNETLAKYGKTSGTPSCGSGLPSGDFTYYSQYDPAWANKPYGSTGKTIESSGCGPSSMAMIIATLKNSSVTPETVATWGAKYYIDGQGSSHALFGAAARHWGLKSETIGANEDAVKAALGAGGLVVAGGSGADPFTSSGHIIVIRGITSSGKYLVGNPLPLPGDQGKASADVARNTAWMEKEYTWAQLSSNSSGMHAITK